ncbi:transcriptional regulator [Arhodomonas sp. AD133]|uniref:transcriptional regulator n=1 Tax=Arhodomonas sp. AD133 TaxID=3415009 RepID=UPI003EBB1F61
MDLHTWLCQPKNTQSGLAEKITRLGYRRVTQGAVSQWLRNGVPPIRCRQIEYATGGAVTAEELRPDVFGPSPDTIECSRSHERDAAA